MEREDEEPGEIVGVTIVRTRSAPCVNDGGAGDDNNKNNNNNPEGTSRTALGVIGTELYPAPAASDDVDQQNHVGFYARAQCFDALALD